MGGVGGQAALTIRIDRAARHDNLLKLSKERFWRRLRLHQPSMIKGDFALREAYRPLVVLRHCNVAWDALAVMIQHIA